MEEWGKLRQNEILRLALEIGVGASLVHREVGILGEGALGPWHGNWTVDGLLGKIGLFCPEGTTCLGFVDREAGGVSQELDE